MKSHWESARRIALERIGGAALDVHHISVVKDRDTERATRSSLAVKTMAHGDL